MSKKANFSPKDSVFLGLMILVLFGLFISSSMTYQEQELRAGFVNHHLAFLEKIVANWNFYYGDRWHNVQLDGGVAGLTQFIVRKIAHFTAYFLVGLFAYLGLNDVYRIPWVAPILIWLDVVGLAAFDEFHQLLTGDRTPSICDVVLDGIGALTAIILCLLFHFLVKLLKKNSKVH